MGYEMVTKTTKKAKLLYCKIHICVYVSVCVCNRAQNHAYYGDENFTGDSIILEEVQRLNFIFKDIFLGYF